MGGKDGVCALCDGKIDERDDVVVITKEPGKKANYYEPEVLGVVCSVCWSGGTDERPTNLNELVKYR